MKRVFIIGWDGATFDLMRPWVEQGKLPAIAKLMKQGSHGLLRSTMPPWTFPAWTSFMTGVNPGKHGIYDFTRRKTGQYALEFVNGGHRKAPTFWQLLSEANRHVVSISVPCTYPPEHVNGVMISGFDAPGLSGPNSLADARGMHPPELYEELREKNGGHPMGASIMKEINSGRPEVGLERVIETVKRKAGTAKYLMANKPWDCFMILFGESDGIGHHFWKYCDPQSPLFTQHPTGLQDSIFRVYQELDRQVADFLDRLPPDTTVLMMSDHGFGGVSNWVLYPNCWLHEQGILKLSGGTADLVSRTLDAVKTSAVATLPGSVKRAIYRMSRGGIGKIESKVRHGIIDWSGTQAYFEENPYFPMLWVNLKGRQPQGVVEPGREYEALRDRLIHDLESWRHPETGKPIIEKAYRREEVYSGPYVEEAADIIPKWSHHNGYSYAYKLSSKSPKRAWIQKVDPHKKENKQFFTGKSGTHRDDGIFLAWGPSVRQGYTVDNARIIDLAPTILHLLGLPVPQHMDGQVLQQIFTDEFTERFTVHKSAQQELAVNKDQSGDNTYSTEDEEVIASRLKALGYID